MSLSGESGHDFLHRTCPLLTQSGHQLAPTSALPEHQCGLLPSRVLSLGSGHEAARVHQSHCWISSHMAARRVRSSRRCRSSDSSAGCRLGHLRSALLHSVKDLTKPVSSMARTWRSNTVGGRPIDRLPALAVDLVNRKAGVIVAYTMPLWPPKQHRRPSPLSSSTATIRLGLVWFRALPGRARTSPA